MDRKIERVAIGWFLISIFAVAVLLTGCRRSVGIQEEVDPATQLLGSWHRSETEIDSHGNEERNEIVLTLTPERYIYHLTEYNEVGEFESATYWSGEWTATETIINTKTKWWNRSEGEWSELVSYEKPYSLDGEVLQVEEWNLFEDDSPAQETYTRYQGISDIIGTWLLRESRESEGNVIHTELRFRITDSTFREEIKRFRDDELIMDWYIEGNVTIDYSRYYMHLETTGHEVIENGGEPFQNPHFVPGQKFRYAFAPTFDPNKVAFSRFWGEHHYDGRNDEWIDHPVYPWGQYYTLYTRVN